MSVRTIWDSESDDDTTVDSTIGTTIAIRNAIKASLAFLFMGSLLTIWVMDNLILIVSWRHRSPGEVSSGCADAAQRWFDWMQAH
jgi:hypothetical protein